MSAATPPCTPFCDYSKAVHKGRATWVCAACGKDISLGYIFWFDAMNGDRK